MPGNENSGRPGQDLVPVGERTRFGQKDGPDPSASAKKRNTEQNPSSVRAAERRLAVQDVDITRPITSRDLVRMFGREGHAVSVAQAIAVTRIKKALAGDAKFSQMVTEDLDGKLVERKVEAKVTLADLVSGSFDDPESIEGDSDSEG